MINKTNKPIIPAHLVAIQLRADGNTYQWIKIDATGALYRRLSTFYLVGNNQGNGMYKSVTEIPDDATPVDPPAPVGVEFSQGYTSAKIIIHPMPESSRKPFAFSGQNNTHVCPINIPHTPHRLGKYPTVNHGVQDIYCLGLQGDSVSIEVKTNEKGDAYYPSFANGYYTEEQGER